MRRGEFLRIMSALPEGRCMDLLGKMARGWTPLAIRDAGGPVRQQGNDSLSFLPWVDPASVIIQGRPRSRS